MTPSSVTSSWINIRYLRGAAVPQPYSKFRLRGRPSALLRRRAAHTIDQQCPSFSIGSGHPRIERGEVRRTCWTITGHNHNPEARLSCKAGLLLMISHRVRMTSADRPAIPPAKTARSGERRRIALRRGTARRNSRSPNVFPLAARQTHGGIRLTVVRHWRGFDRRRCVLGDLLSGNSRFPARSS